MRSLLDAFRWPLRTPVRLAILLGLGLAMGSLRWLPWGGPGRRHPGPYAAFGFLFLSACAVSWLFGIVRRTTHPDDLRPETVERELDKDDAWEDLLQFLGATAVAYLPLLGLLGHALAFDGRAWEDVAFRAAVAALAAAGTAYFPMALMLLGYTGEWRAAFNLPLGVRSMRRLGAGYGACAALFLAAAGTACLLELLWVRRTSVLTWPGWTSRTAASLAELYLGAAAMRALGLLYLANADRLGWIARNPT